MNLGSLQAQSDRNLVAQPAQVTLRGNFAQAQLLIQQIDPSSTGNPSTASELSSDFTSQSVFQSLTPEIVTVSPSGCLTAVSNGSGKVSATVEGRTIEIPVEVAGLVDAPQVDFHRDLLPLITRSGCHAGSCHASQYGNPLPPGVVVDIGASKTLLTAGEAAGHITFKANPDAAAVERHLVPITVHVSINFVMKHTFSSEPFYITVKK
jgi:hypothetical protein